MFWSAYRAAPATCRRFWNGPAGLAAAVAVGAALVVPAQSFAGYSVNYPRYIDGSHHHAGEAPAKRATVQIRRGSDVFDQALLGARGRLDPDPRSGTVGYARVHPGVSVVYDAQGTALKETLVLVDRAARSSFRFWVSGRRGETPLRAVLQPDRSVRMEMPDGEAVFSLPAPFMWDSGGSASRAVAVSVSPSARHGAPGYEIVISADRAWLNDPARRFPVAVDPTVITEDTCVRVLSIDCLVRISPTHGPDVPGYENLSVPGLSSELRACVLDLEQPGTSCDVEGLVPRPVDDVEDNNVEAGLPRTARSWGAPAKAAQAYAFCGAGAFRPKREPGPGRPGPYFVSGKAKAACAGNAVRSATITACLAVNKGGTYLNLDCTGNVSRTVNRGAIVVTATARWCCEPGRYFYRTQAFATGTLSNGATIPSDIEEAYTKKKIRC